VFADMDRIDETWAIGALAARACALGANAIVLSKEFEATPLRLAVPLRVNYIAFEADTYRLR
jgi:hypothetical protein